MSNCAGPSHDCAGDAGAAPSSDAAANASANGSAGADGGEDPAAKRQRTADGSEEGAPSTDAAAAAAEGAATATSLSDEDSAANLEASLQSCTAHRDRILQMLQEEPENRNLIELRDQLTNAINQLQGTKNMVQRARSGRPQGQAMGVAQPMGADGSRPAKGHSSRKNKPQRCSVCGGIGHKSRTCSMAVTPNAQQMCQPVQWATTQPGCASMQPGGDPSQMYVPVGGGYVMANGQQGGAMQPGMAIGQAMPGQMQAQMQGQMQAQGMTMMQQPGMMQQMAHMGQQMMPVATTMQMAQTMPVAPGTVMPTQMTSQPDQQSIPASVAVQPNAVAAASGPPQPMPGNVPVVEHAGAAAAIAPTPPMAAELTSGDPTFAGLDAGVPAPATDAGDGLNVGGDGDEDGDEDDGEDDDDFGDDQE